MAATTVGSNIGKPVNAVNHGMSAMQIVHRELREGNVVYAATQPDEALTFDKDLDERGQGTLRKTSFYANTRLST